MARAGSLIDGDDTLPWPEWRRWLDPVLVKARIREAEAGDRGAREFLRHAVAVHLTERVPMPEALMDYHAAALNDFFDPVGRLGLRRGRGRDAYAENARKQALGCVIAYLLNELGDEKKAYARAARLLGYKDVRALKAACGKDLARLLERLKDDPSRESQLAWQVLFAGDLLLRVQS